MEKEKIKEHFDELSDDYDSYKKRNKFYYKALKRILKREVGFGKKVLDVGCGTGELLDFLKCKEGKGIDVSEGMIEKAKEKYDLNFEVGDIENLEKEDYDFVLLIDVVEHLSDIRKGFSELRKFKKVLVSFVNPLFEPLLMIMEKLNLKMEEGPHNRVSVKEMKKIFKENRFKIVKEKYELFGLIKYFVLENEIYKT